MPYIWQRFSMNLKQFSTLTFDCYGTLIDWETGLYEALQPLLNKTDRSFNKSEALREFRKAESPVQKKRPNLRYDELLMAVHRQFAHRLHVQADERMHRQFAQSIQDWPPFPDTVPALRYLKRHHQLVILSNVHNEGFAHSNRLLEVEFDAVYTAEDIGSYKPSTNNFQYMLSKLKAHGIQKTALLHVAQSMYHDMVPATELGLATCWINRRHGQSDSGATPPVARMVTTDWSFVSLAHMVDRHRQEM